MLKERAAAVGERANELLSELDSLEIQLAGPGVETSADIPESSAAVRRQVQETKTVWEKKVDDPTGTFIVTDIYSQVVELNEGIDQANDLIAAHNSIVSNVKKASDELVD